MCRGSVVLFTALLSLTCVIPAGAWVWEPRAQLLQHARCHIYC
jgi:hypothetical protein